MGLYEELGIEPERDPSMTLPVPPEADDSWCEMVNFMYGGQGYRTEVLADFVWRGKVTADGRLRPAEYTPQVFKLDDKGLAHNLGGTLIKVEMMPFYPLDSTDGLTYPPHAVMEDVTDLTGREPLTRRAGERIMAPLLGMTALLLRRRR